MKKLSWSRAMAGLLVGSLRIKRKRRFQLTMTADKRPWVHSRSAVDGLRHLPHRQPANACDLSALAPVCRSTLVPMRMFTRFSVSLWPRLGAACTALLTVALCVLLPAQVQAKAASRTSNPAWPEARASGTYADHHAAQAWGQGLAERSGLDAQQVRKVLDRAHRLPAVEQLVLPPAKPQLRNWQAYRARFVEPRRIAAGQRFWDQHARTLARAEQVYGVPAALVVGIIGVETLYGQHTGRFRVLDALSTLAFDFPQAHPRAAQRQQFFRDELGHFLQMTLGRGLDPVSIRGSYAGAMGLPQFMPSSWLQYAVDFDGDGHIDLLGNPDDAIGSVARYLQAHRWQPGQATHFGVQVPRDPDRLQQLLAPDILPTFSVQGAGLGASARQHTGPLALVELRNGEAAPSYVLGTENFYAITRYNWSSYYAMAVIELGEAIAQSRQGRQARR